MATQTMTSEMATESPRARSGLFVSSLAAPGAPTIKLNIKRAPTTGTDIVVATATTTRKQISMDWVPTPRPCHVRDDGGEQERAVQGGYGGYGSDAEQPGDEQLVVADTENLAEEEGEGLRRVLLVPAQEQGPEAEHEHQGEGRHGVVTAPLAQNPDGEGAQDGEGAEAGKGAHPDQRGACGACETGLGDGVGHEGRPS